jgi:hypothetical protein
LCFDGRSRVEVDGGESLPALAELALGQAASGGDAREPRARGCLKAGDATRRLHDR